MQPSRRLASILFAVLGLAASLVGKRSRARTRFRNNYPHPPPGDFRRWQRERREAGLPKIPRGGYHLPQADPDLDFLSRNRREATATWIGHATLLLQIDGVNILTDPQFSTRASPVPFLGPRRQMPPVPRLADLPHIDVVVISHNHYDHLDKASVHRLVRQSGGSPRFFVPLGLAQWFHKQGIENVAELGWWDQAQFSNLTLHCVPVQHWSARTLFNRNETLWCGWVIAGKSAKFFFAGDTGYSADFGDIYRRLGHMDIAALPIGGYAPRWFMAPMHIGPEDAVQIVQDMHIRCAVGMHWGTFPLTDEPFDEPPRRLRDALTAAKLPAERFVVLKHGETRRIDALLAAASEIPNTDCAMANKTGFAEQRAARNEDFS